MKKEKLTVIIPTYCVEEYIDRCLDSLVNQSFPDIKILIVDDASTDGTIQILEKYEKHFNNIKVYYNKERMGPSWCRDYLLKLIDTEYVTFLDGDDWLDLDTYEKALNSFTDEIDIVLWDIDTVWGRSNYESRYSYQHTNVINNTMALRLFSREMPYKYYISPLLGNKIFRTKMLQMNNITFDCCYYEDDIFTFKALVHSSSIAIIPQSKLYYYQRKDSFSRKFSANTISGFYKSFCHLKKYLTNLGLWEKTAGYYYAYYEKCIANLQKECYRHGLTQKEERCFYKALLCGFYASTDLSEYCKYCDLNMFPL